MMKYKKGASALISNFHKWFSEDGITLKSDEIFLKYQEYNTLKTNMKLKKKNYSQKLKIQH